MSQATERSRRRYRFDPLSAGVFLGLGQVRLAIVAAICVFGVALMFYAGQVVVGVLLVLVGPWPVVWTREGLPGLVWVALRVHYRLSAPTGRGWSVDPELVPHEDPAPPGVGHQDQTMQPEGTGR